MIRVMARSMAVLCFSIFTAKSQPTAIKASDSLQKELREGRHSVDIEENRLFQ